MTSAADPETSPQLVWSGLRRQITYDLAQARRREHRIDVARHVFRLAVSG